MHLDAQDPKCMQTQHCLCIQRWHAAKDCVLLLLHSVHHTLVQCQIGCCLSKLKALTRRAIRDVTHFTWRCCSGIIGTTQGSAIAYSLIHLYLSIQLRISTGELLYRVRKPVAKSCIVTVLVQSVVQVVSARLGLEDPLIGRQLHRRARTCPSTHSARIWARKTAVSKLSCDDCVCISQEPRPL